MDFRDLEAFMGEHELVPAYFFASPDSPPVEIFVRIIEEGDGGSIRFALQDHNQDLNAQILFPGNKLRARIDDPTIFDPPG